jgi:hypothetical protein
VDLSQIVGSDNIRTVPVRVMAPHIEWLTRVGALPPNPSDDDISTAIGMWLDAAVNAHDKGMT